MEASLPAITPATVPPAKTGAQAPPASEETTPFSNFLDAARAENTPQESQESVDTKTTDSNSSQQEVMAAELTALSLQEVPVLPVNHQLSGQEASITFSSRTDSTSLLAPAMPVPPANAERTALQQIMTMPGDEPAKASQTAPDSALEAAQGMSTESPGINSAKGASLLTQQIESILQGDPRNAVAVHSPVLPVPEDSLNSLSSPYLQSAMENTTKLQSLATRTVANVDGKLTADADTSLPDPLDKHLLDTQIEAISNQRSSGNQQQEKGHQENSARGMNTAMATPTVSHINNEAMSQFIATGPGAPTTATTQGHATLAQPASFPPGVHVPAEDLVRHLVERFSVNPRLQTSKISLNLHPAELGVLKIDILVKGDSIKAHIAAGNQQIQDTIEKNMPKLRSILEQQGFTVEDFKVTLESANSSSNDFFQQQFSSRQDSAPRVPFVPDNSPFEISLNSAEELFIGPMDSGINLSI